MLRRNLISTGKVAKKCGVSSRTVENWDDDLADDFPKSVRRNNRRYWDEHEVDAYIERMFARRDRRQSFG